MLVQYTTIILLISDGPTKYSTMGSSMSPSCPQNYYVSLDLSNTTYFNGGLKSHDLTLLFGEIRYHHTELSFYLTLFQEMEKVYGSHIHSTNNARYNAPIPFHGLVPKERSHQFPWQPQNISHF